MTKRIWPWTVFVYVDNFMVSFIDNLTKLLEI